MEKVLVTGGCGFIGSHMVDYLMKHNHEVYVIDNLSLGKNHWEGQSYAPSLFINDILDFNLCENIFKDIQPDVVIHLAANHYIPFCENNPYQAYNLNVKGTINILELSRKYGVKKFFFASTGDVYAPSFAPHREVDIASPIYVYGHTKYIGELVCVKYFSKMKDASLTIGRLFNAAGGRETNPHLLPEVVRQIANGKRTIEVGNLWPLRDFVDVSSMAGVIADLTLAGKGIDIVNIGSGIVQDVGSALGILTSVLPFKVDIVSVKEKQRPNDRAYLCPDTNKLTKLLGRSARPFDFTTAKDIFRESGIVN